MDADIVKSGDFRNAAPVFGQLSFDDHEQVVFCRDKDTGLKAIIGIHNTVLGPSLGGTRMWNYKSEWEALNDVLRLSRGMTYKSAVTGLDLGGGKAVLIGDSRTQKTPELMRKFGEFVDDLNGKYITAEDVGMETADMDTIHEVTNHVTGISESKGGSGNPSPITAYGVFMGMKAAAEFKYGSADLKGKKVLVQGVGHVGISLVERIINEGGKVVVSDIDRERLEAVKEKYNVEILEGDHIYATDVDIYAPCAMGATLNEHSIKLLKADIVAGSANNQLANEELHSKELMKKGIVYAPDFLINAGGIINVYAELKGYDREQALQKTENIYHTTLEVLTNAKKKNITPHQAAEKIAEERIENRKNENEKA